MAPDAVAEVVIEELVLRVAAMAPEDARALGADVARRLAERLRGTGGSVRLDDVRVTVPPGLTGAALAEAIAAEIASRVATQADRSAR